MNNQRQPGQPDGSGFVNGQMHVLADDVEGVHIPRTLKGALGNHVYADAVTKNGNVVKAYIPVAFDPAENQYPKMLYHPEYGKKPEPSIGDYARGATTNEMYQAALEVYQAAKFEWEKGNRTILAADGKREAELRKIGWVDYKDLKHLSAAVKKSESDQL